MCVWGAWVHRKLSCCPPWSQHVVALMPCLGMNDYGRDEGHRPTRCSDSFVCVLRLRTLSTGPNPQQGTQRLKSGLEQWR